MRKASLGILLTLFTIASILPVAAPGNFTVGLAPFVRCLSPNGFICPTSASFTVTVTPSGGFVGTVTLTTTYSLVGCIPNNSNPIPPTPSFSAAFVTITGSGSVQSTLTFSTTASTTITCLYSVTVTGASPGSTSLSNTVYVLVIW